MRWRVAAMDNSRNRRLGWPDRMLADREGFEPSVGVIPLRRFSKPLVSATHPRLREAEARPIEAGIGSFNRVRALAPKHGLAPGPRPPGTASVAAGEPSLNRVNRIFANMLSTMEPVDVRATI